MPREKDEEFQIPIRIRVNFVNSFIGLRRDEICWAAVHVRSTPFIGLRRYEMCWAPVHVKVKSNTTRNHNTRRYDWIELKFKYISLGQVYYILN